MTPFEYFLEAEGFQADACVSTIHPDFFQLAEQLWTEREALRLQVAYEKERGDHNFRVSQYRLKALKEAEAYTRGDYDPGLHGRLVAAINAVVR